MKKTRTIIEVSKLQLNTGQMQWLPKNPRQWTQTDLDRTKKSITEDEDFLEDRPVLVVPNGKKYCVFAGNLRTTALQELKAKTTPAIVYEPETEDDRAVVVRRAMKDNGSFGSWDFDTLANEWDNLPLTDWGVPAWGLGNDIPEVDLTIPHNAMGAKDGEYSSITFVFSVDQVGVVNDWIAHNSKEELSIKIVELCRNAEAK